MTIDSVSKGGRKRALPKREGRVHDSSAGKVFLHNNKDLNLTSQYCAQRLGMLCHYLEVKQTPGVQTGKPSQTCAFHDSKRYCLNNDHNKTKGAVI